MPGTSRSPEAPDRGSETAAPAACTCAQRPRWDRLEDDRVLTWPVQETNDWEELRQCPVCGQHWLGAWPEELEGGAILCRPVPEGARRLKDIDRVETLRGYCLARLEEHLGSLKEQKAACIKVGCERRKVVNTSYCIEHLIARRFGRHLSRLPRQQDDD